MLQKAPAVTLSLPTAAATHQLGLLLGRSLPPGSVILLEGNLGSGKTTLVQGLGEGLGVTEPLVSPTFGLVHEYLEGRFPLYHLDLYRLQPFEVEELHPEVYWQEVETPLGIVAIEWPDRLQPWPPDYLHIHLSDADQGRRAVLTAVGEMALPTDQLGSPLHR